MSLIKTQDGWKKLAPKSCGPATPEDHPARVPLVKNEDGQLETQASIDFRKKMRSDVNESREQRGLSPLTDADVYTTKR